MRQQKHKQLRRLDSVQVPSREEIESILQANSLVYDQEMTSEQLWDLWVTYYNARYQLISSLSPSNDTRQRVIEKINTTNYSNEMMRCCNE